MQTESYSVVAIIPLYNGAKYIRKSLESVLTQSMSPAEIIVVDDGSTDGGEGARIAAEVANGHNSFRLITKANGGQSSARNLGVAQSKSDLIAFLDQDDAWYPEHLEKLARPFRRGPQRVGWVYSDLDQVDADWNMICRRFLHTLPTAHPKRDILTCLSQDMFVLPSASLTRREAFDAVGGFDERLCGYEDDDLFLRMFRKGYDNIFLPEALSVWRIHAASTSYTSRMAQSRLIYLDKLVEMFPDEVDMNRYWRRDAIAPRFRTHFLAEYLRCVRQGKPDGARESLTSLRSIVGLMRFKHRLVLGAAMPVMANFTLARISCLLGLPALARRAMH